MRKNDKYLKNMKIHKTLLGIYQKPNPNPSVCLGTYV